MELYNYMGFTTNPFSTFSAEEEKDFLKFIYINPLFFDSLKSDIVSGHSRFILGVRGIGKTALILRLKEAIQKDNIYCLVIDSYEGIALKHNAETFLRHVLKTLINSFTIYVSKNKFLLKNLDRNDKEILSILILEFFSTISTNQFRIHYNKVTKYKAKNFFKHFFNSIINKPINIIISAGTEVIGDTIRAALGLPKVQSNVQYRQYIPPMQVESPIVGNNADNYNFVMLRTMLEDMCKIIKKCGFSNTAIFFDKIDEYTQLNSNVSLVCEFLEDILRDTTVLMNENYSLVFSLWDALKSGLSSKGVRFDKILPVDITWNPSNLVNILKKRIRYFSNGHTTINSVISEYDLTKIIRLSNNSPRYMFRILAFIYNNQSVLDKQSKCFSHHAIKDGMVTYAKNFDYYAIYQKSVSSKTDILTNINKLLRIGKQQIMTSDFVSVFKVSTPSAISYIGIMLNYNLIKELPVTEQGAKVYEINDPVLAFLIDTGITEVNK